MFKAFFSKNLHILSPRRSPSLITKPFCLKFSSNILRKNRFNPNFQPLCLFLVGVNTFLFFSWNYGWISKEDLLENFSISKENMDKKYYHTLLFSGFFHENKWHFLLNTSALFIFGSKLEMLMGPVPFLATYCLASIVAGLSFHWYYDSGEEKYKNRRVGAIAPASAVMINIGFFLPPFLGVPPVVLMGAILCTSVVLSGTKEEKDEDFDYGGVFPGILVGLGSVVYVALKIASKAL